MWLRRRRRADELAQALREIERQRRFTQAIFDSVDVGLVLLDEHGHYQTVNRRHADFMALAFPGGHDGQAGQRGLVFREDGVTPFEPEEMSSLRAAHGEEFDDVRMWVGDDPMTRRALSVSARAVRDDAGRFRGAALAYKDVTDYVQAMRVKDQFIATVSHEFRTPLTSIHGYVAMLLDEEEDLSRETAGYLKVVARNTDRLHRLVSDLLLSAASDSQPVESFPSVTDLSEIVRACVESAELVAQRARIRLSHRAPAYLCVMADPQRLAQVVDNLISNAVKYTLPGGWVRVELAARGPETVELTVADNGIGIAEEDRARLFSRFFRAREAEDRSIQGVGLGLSIVKQIVDGHGGRVDVDSQPGVGSTFRVRLPTGTIVFPATGATVPDVSYRAPAGGA